MLRERAGSTMDPCSPLPVLPTPVDTTAPPPLSDVALRRRYTHYLVQRMETYYTETHAYGSLPPQQELQTWTQEFLHTYPLKSRRRVERRLAVGLEVRVARTLEWTGSTVWSAVYLHPRELDTLKTTFITRYAIPPTPTPPGRRARQLLTTPSFFDVVIRCVLSYYASPVCFSHWVPRVATWLTRYYRTKWAWNDVWTDDRWREWTEVVLPMYTNRNKPVHIQEMLWLYQPVCDYVDRWDWPKNAVYLWIHHFPPLVNRKGPSVSAHTQACRHVWDPFVLAYRDTGRPSEAKLLDTGTRVWEAWHALRPSVRITPYTEPSQLYSASTPGTDTLDPDDTRLLRTGSVNTDGDLTMSPLVIRQFRLARFDFSAPKTLTKRQRRLHRQQFQRYAYLAGTRSTRPPRARRPPCRYSP